MAGRAGAPGVGRAHLLIGYLLADGGVPLVALFIGAAMTVGIAVIWVFGPSTRGVALEQRTE